MRPSASPCCEVSELIVYEYVNPAFQALAPESMLLGRPFAQANWEMPEVLERLRDVWSTGEPWQAINLPLQVSRSPGAPLAEGYFSISCVKVRCRTLPDILLGFVLETTDRMRALQDMRRRAAGLEGIINTMVEGVMVVQTAIVIFA